MAERTPVAETVTEGEGRAGGCEADEGRERRRVLVALPGLHRVNRGAEVAFESVSHELAKLPGYEVTLVGAGWPREGAAYRFIHVGCVGRERFEKLPPVPVLRSEYAWEEMTFAPGLWRAYEPAQYDVTMTCSYPFCNWVLARRKRRGARPAHVYVTQNGDWPARADHREYRFFRCDGLVCTNPDYYEANRDRWRAVLIPNGVDPDLFTAGEGDREALGLPEGVPIALMVSALIRSKRVVEGIRCAAKVEGLHLVVAGDGPERDEVEATGRELMGERFRRVTLPRPRMPELYRCADVFLHMSMDEPSANAYIEALASGLPIVTHDRRVTRWTLEEHGLLVDTADADAVAGAIRRALERWGPERAAAQREMVGRRFAWSVIARRYAEFFETLAGAGASGGDGRP